MDVQRGISAPFADQNWLVKTLWASLWSGLGITAPATAGYTLDYVRNVAYGYETPLPEWNKDFGRWWVRGFLLMLAGFIYLLPAIILFVAGFLPLLASIVSGSGPNGSYELSRSVGLLSSGAICGAGALAVIYTIAVSVFFYGAYVNYALSEDFGALFRVGEILARIKTPGAGYFTAWAVSIGVSMVAGMAGGFAGSILGATGVLAPLAGFIGGGIGFVGGLMVAHVFGQYAAKAYGLPGVSPAYMAPPSYTAAGYQQPPAPPAAQPPYPAAQPPYPPQPPYAAPQAQPPYAPTAEAPASGAPESASSAHSEPDSPMPSYSPEQTAPPSRPDSDPPAEDGGA